MHIFGRGPETALAAFGCSLKHCDRPLPIGGCANGVVAQGSTQRGEGKRSSIERPASLFYFAQGPARRINGPDM